MKNIWDWIKNNPNRTMFLIPIILVAGISISHVVTWYDIANPISWAVYLSIAIEVAAMTALVAVMNRIKGGVWFMFGLVTFIQMIGNIFFSFNEVDSEGKLFKSWIELTSPLWEAIGSDINDVVSMKRWLAFLEGGLLPIISLTSLHFFIKYDDKPLTLNKETKNKDEILKTEVENSFSPFLNEDSVIDSKNNIESSIEDSKKNNESSTENLTNNSESSTENSTNNRESSTDNSKNNSETSTENLTNNSESSTENLTNNRESSTEKITETTKTPEKIVDVPIVEEVVDVPIVEEVVDVPIVEEVVDVPIVEEVVETTSIPEEIINESIIEEIVTSTSEEIINESIIEEIVTSTSEEIIDVPIVENVNETTEVKIKRLSYKRTS